VTRVAKQEGHEKKLRAKKVKAFDAQDDSAKSAVVLPAKTGHLS
jgi:hypothetical protein